MKLAIRYRRIETNEMHLLVVDTVAVKNIEGAARLARQFANEHLYEVTGVEVLDQFKEVKKT